MFVRVRGGNVCNFLLLKSIAPYLHSHYLGVGGFRIQIAATNHSLQKMRARRQRGSPCGSMLAVAHYHACSWTLGQRKYAFQTQPTDSPKASTLVTSLAAEESSGFY